MDTHSSAHSAHRSLRSALDSLETKKQRKNIFPRVALAAARCIDQDAIKAFRHQITKCSAVQQRYHVIPGMVYDDWKKHGIEIE